MIQHDFRMLRTDKHNEIGTYQFVALTLKLHFKFVLVMKYDNA